MENVERGEAYYTLMGQKNIEGIKKCLNPQVEFFGPFAALKGKEAVVEAISNFMKMFKTLTLKAKFGTKDQAMMV